MGNDVQDFGDYAVKSVKSFVGNEGYGFNANLYRNGKKIGFCYDDAGGGGMHPIDWLGTPNSHDDKDGWEKWRKFRDEEQRLLDLHIAGLPKVESEHCDGGLTVDESWFVTELVSKWERERDMKKLLKQCKTKTLFRHSKCKFGGYVIMSAICDEKTRAKLKKDYGEDVEIFNDVLDAGKIPSVFQS